MLLRNPSQAVFFTEAFLHLNLINFSVLILKMFYWLIFRISLNMKVHNRANLWEKFKKKNQKLYQKIMLRQQKEENPRNFVKNHVERAKRRKSNYLEKILTFLLEAFHRRLPSPQNSCLKHLYFHLTNLQYLIIVNICIFRKFNVTMSLCPTEFFNFFYVKGREVGSVLGNYPRLYQALASTAAQALLTLWCTACHANSQQEFSALHKQNFSLRSDNKLVLLSW